MANIIYLTINGKTQGLISANCSSADSVGIKMQENHRDEVLVYSFDHELSYLDNVYHQPISIIKAIDRASPLLAIAISSGEKLDCEFNFYRTAVNGGLEKYYYIKISEAKIISINPHFPNSLTHNESQPYEQIRLSYDTIVWKHLKSNTYGYSFWHNPIVNN